MRARDGGFRKTTLIRSRAVIARKPFITEHRETPCGTSPELPRRFDANSPVERPTSPDGKRLVYLEQRGDSEGGAPALPVMFLFNS